MLILTSKERKILLLIAVLIFIGSIVRAYFFKTEKQETCAVRTVHVSEGLEPARKEKKFPDTVVQPIHINTAEADQLESLPGVGSEIAGRIIEYRNTHGNFTCAQDLENVKGIGKKKIELIKPFLIF